MDWGNVSRTLKEIREKKKRSSVMVGNIYKRKKRSSG
jgi:hypothetical protein